MKVVSNVKVQSHNGNNMTSHESGSACYFHDRIQYSHYPLLTAEMSLSDPLHLATKLARRTNTFKLW